MDNERQEERDLLYQGAASVNPRRNLSKQAIESLNLLRAQAPVSEREPIATQTLIATQTPIAVHTPTPAGGDRYIL